MTLGAAAPPVLFIHNPKAGGTSLAHHLRRAYRPEEVAPLVANSPGEPGPEAWSGRGPFRFASGHFGYGALDHFAAGVAVITNFREPVSRIVSLFDYWRLNFNDAVIAANPESGPALIRAMSFQDFITTDNPHLSLYIHDFHARQLLGSGWEPRRVGWLELRRLRQRIEGLAWFFVCELPELSAAWFTHALPGLEPYDGAQRLNATDYAKRPRTRPTSEEVSLILARNRADSAIYAHAVQVLLRRAGEQPAAVVRKSAA